MKQYLQHLKENKRHGSFDFPLAFYEVIRQNITIPHHWHEEVEIVYIEKGTVQLEIQTEKTTAKAPVLIFINPLELHAIKLSKDCVEQAILFQLKLLNFDSYDYVQSHFLEPLMEEKLKFPRIISVNTDVGKELKKEFLAICTEYQKAQPSSYLKMKASLLQIIGILESYNCFLNAAPSALDMKKVEPLKAVLSYIKEHYMEKIYLADLSAILNFEQHYFCRFFKQAIGESPMEYLLHYRIRRAAKLLLSTDRLILDICYECGFENAGYFIRQFKKYYGCTPSAYRKKIK